MDTQANNHSAQAGADFHWQVPTTFNFATDVVDRWAEDPERLALIAVDANGVEQRFSYADISRLSSQLANMLAAYGVRKGDRVLILLPRIPQWQIAMVAATRLGAVAIPCITMLTEKDIAYRVNHSRATAVITDSAETSKFAGLDSLATRVCVGEAPTGWTAFSEILNYDEQFVAPEIAAEDQAILYYTSGSTGSPKGVSHASRALWAWGNSAQYWLGLKTNDRIWCTADTGWSKAGTSILFGPWSQGASVLFYSGPFDAAKRFELLSRYQVSCFCAAATELRRLIHEDVSLYDLSKLKTTVSAGESVNPEIIERWKELTGNTILDGYGQTESLMLVTNRRHLPVKPGSMGVPLPGVQVGVRTAEGAVATGKASGELLVRLPNPQLMLEYRDDPKKTASTRYRVDGVEWYATGDNVEIDEDGYLFYTGRSDDIISSSGYRIGPQEVENILMEHPAVQECAVVGVPDEERGELVKAWVVLNDSYTGSDEMVRQLQQFAKEMTAPYKYPRRVAFTEELPKTVTGKIRRNLLRELG